MRVPVLVCPLLRTGFQPAFTVMSEFGFGMPCSIAMFYGRTKKVHCDRFALFSQGIEWVGQLDQLAYKIGLQETAGEVKVSTRL